MNKHVYHCVVCKVPLEPPLRTLCWKCGMYRRFGEQTPAKPETRTSDATKAAIR
jgi:hypothetical protein